MHIVYSKQLTFHLAQQLLHFADNRLKQLLVCPLSKNVAQLQLLVSANARSRKKHSQIDRPILEQVDYEVLI